MAAKPKMTPEQWASTRAAWEADPRKALPWLIQELGLPVSAEALRLRARSEVWEKGQVAEPVTKLAENPKLVKAKPKLAEFPKPKLVTSAPRLGDDGKDDAQDADSPPVELSKVEQERVSTIEPTEERFAEEYLIDLNATQAYMRVFTHITVKSARTLGPRMLGKVGVAEKIYQLKKERSERTEISADRVLVEAWSMATADSRELVQVKVGCCRYCHSEGHQRQRTVGEMNRDREKHVAKSKDLADFDEEGGIGFNSLLPPHAECPECCGDGQARTVLMDTRNLSPQAAALYAGAKQGKHGIEVQMHSKADAMDKVFRHLGLYEKDKDVNVNVFPPREVLDAIYEKALGEAAKRDAMLAGRRERLGIVIENGESHE